MPSVGSPRQTCPGWDVLTYSCAIDYFPLTRFPRFAAWTTRRAGEQVEQNIRYVDDLTAEDLAEIDAILEAAPEISWDITNGGADQPYNNADRAAVGLAKL
eukprot:SAG22_NODE_73_length_22318_cov_47.105315_25_plen_101_part_00